MTKKKSFGRNVVQGEESSREKPLPSSQERRGKAQYPDVETTVPTETFQDVLDGYGVSSVNDFVELSTEARIEPDDKDANEDLHVRIEKLAETLQVPTATLVDALEQSAHELNIVTAVDGSLSIDKISASGRRARRSGAALTSPDQNASNEVNRRDSKIVAHIPTALLFRFGKLRKSLGYSTMKSAFEEATHSWLVEGKTLSPYSGNDALLDGVRKEFQVRVEGSTNRSISIAAAESGRTKRDCIEEILMRFVQHNSL